MTKKEENKLTVQSLKEKVLKAKSITFTDYKGLDAQAVNQLRTKMKESDAEFVVAKNTLLKVATKDIKNADKIEKDLEGPTAAIFGYADAITPIKIIYDFAKKLELPKVKSALIEGIYNTAEQVEVIKSLPSKEQLLAQIVGGLKSPLNGLVAVTSGVQRKFVYALSAIAQKKK